MDNDTRYLPPNDAARAPGAEEPPNTQTTTSGNGNGTPTTYLPPVPGTQAASTPDTRYAVPPPPAAGGDQQPAPAYGPWGAYGRGRYFGRHRGTLPLLIIAGAVLLFSGTLTHVFAAAFPLALGLIFLYASRQSGRWGLSIPGYILTGLGAGGILGALLGAPGLMGVGLGLGFVALWAQNRAQWWWLIPGAAIGLGGLSQIADGTSHGRGIILPLLLIAFVAFMLRGRGRRVRV